MNKKTVYKIKGLYRDDFRVTGYEFGSGKRSVCIVGPCRGNEMQQLYVCSQLVKKFKQLEEEKRIKKGCKVLIIPTMNSYSYNIQKRFWSTDGTDINRMFPGYDEGETTQRIADGVFREVSKYDIGIQFTSFYMPGEFMPHIRMMKTENCDVEMAKQFGLPYVVLKNIQPFDTTTLNYNWQVWDKQAFSFYTTTTKRIDRASAGMAILSILSFLAQQGIVKYQGPMGVESEVIEDTDLVTVQTARSGLFEGLVNVGDEVKIGTPIANIVDPYDGDIVETLYAPCDCRIFFEHSDPLTYANTVVFKLVRI
ncbi:MAG: M14 family metallopeptidase [Eubacteriales bacterium]|nr:M14 family metallopeptidase [Eubacteriales bacterium]